jgi:hypothetical protein
MEPENPSSKNRIQTFQKNPLKTQDVGNVTFYPCVKFSKQNMLYFGLSKITNSHSILGVDRDGH